MLATGISSSVSADEWSNEVSSLYYSEHSGDDVDRIKDVSLKYIKVLVLLIAEMKLLHLMQV